MGRGVANNGRDGCDKARIVIQRARALELDTESLGECLALDVDVVEDFDMIAHETDGDEQDRIVSGASDLGDHVRNVGPEPCLGGGARALIRETPLLETSPLCDVSGASFELAGCER